MKKPDNIENIYFIGIGGIGMSALARYFKSAGKQVAGYDRVSSPLTDSLIREGILLHFSDNPKLIPENFHNKEKCLVVYTPAIPKDHTEYNYFIKNGFEIKKRSEILGRITREKRGIAIAGTHGKTTISSMLAIILNQSENGCNAFLGGISKNLDSNLLLNTDSETYVVEADEFDRSFLELSPEIALVSSLDPDHLDIYNDYSGLKAAFREFIGKIKSGGKLVLKKGLEKELDSNIESYSYHLNNPEADFYAKDIKRNGFHYSFSLITPTGIVKDLKLGVYGKVNLENAIAALSIAYLMKSGTDVLKKGISEFKGVKRRFDVQLETDEHIFIDDYAHHPEEIKAFLNSVKEAFPEKKITGIFQPHLFSRTRDFAIEFARALSELDNVILLNIYPAREKLIPGVSSNLIFDRLKNKGEKILCSKDQVFKVISEINPEVLLTMGAGDVDRIVDGIKNILQE